MTAMTLQERSLTELESVIERGIHTFVEVGNALREISERRLYRNQGFSTFEQYCDVRWRWSRQHAYKYIAAAQVLENVASMRHSNATPSLTQAIELSAVTADRQREIAGRVDFSKTTVKQLKAEIRRVCQPTVVADLADEKIVTVTRRRRRTATVESEIVDLLNRWEARTDKRVAGIEIHRTSQGRIKTVAIQRVPAMGGGVA